jgi:hypothetical protein
MLQVEIIKKNQFKKILKSKKNNNYKERIRFDSNKTQEG